MHKESLMTTPAVSVTVFNPPEEKKTKKAGGSLMVPREDYGVGSIVRAISKNVLASKKRWNKLWGISTLYAKECSG